MCVNKCLKIFPICCFFTIMLIFCSILCSCRTKSSKNSQTQNDFRRVITVKAEKMAKETQLTSFGTVSYKSKHDISSLVEGSVKQIYVKEGDFVRNGQRLALLRNIQLETQKEQCENALDSAKASLAVAESDLREQERAIESRILSIEKQTLSIKQQQIEYENAQVNHENNKQLHELGGVTDLAIKSEELSLQAQKTQIEIAQKELEISKLGLQDQDIINEGFEIPEDKTERQKILVKINTKSAAAQVMSAKASVSNAEKNLQSVNRMIEELTVKAGVSGIIGTKNFEEGEYVAANTAIFTVLNTSSVYAVFSIQEKDIEKYNTGTKVLISLPSLNKEFTTLISEISPYADPQSGNFSVKALIQNPSNEIKPGIFVKSTVIKQSPDYFVVLPETAVIQGKDNSFSVYSVKNNLAVILDVKVDFIEDGKAWISNGLKEGTIVIDKPSPFLKEGEHVTTE